MKLLGIESSGLVASVGVSENGLLLGEYTTNFKKTHSQTLLPMLDELKRMLDLDLSTIDAVAVSAGPGSFTGLRIGAATAKGLGYALDVPIVAVPTLEVLAYHFWGSNQLICPLMDARRGQTYTGIYQFVDGALETVYAQCAVAIADVIEEVNKRGEAVIFNGDGVPVFTDYILSHCTAPYTFAPAHQNRQDAATLLALAEVYYKAGRVQTAAEHRPEYLRLSQAERERLEKQKADEK